MHIRVRAPLLSAAFSIVRNWIMILSCLRARLALLGLLLDDLEQRPGLVPRHRATRGDDDEIAVLGRALVIVSEQLRRAADELAVRRMLHQTLDFHRNGLVHLGADDPPGERARALRFHLRFHLSAFRAHVYLPPALAVCCLRSMVFTRAMLRRAMPNWSGLGCCPVARCMRSENCSLRSFSSSSASSAGDCLLSFSRYCFSCPIFITAPAVSRTRWTRRAWSPPGETPRAPSPHPRPPSRTTPCPAARAPRNTPRCPCPSPCALRAASSKSARPERRGSRSGRHASHSAPWRGAPPR